MRKAFLRKVAGLLAVVWVLIVFTPASAVSLRDAAWRDVRAKAECIVAARVKSLEFERTSEPNCHGVQTRMRLSETEVLAGDSGKSLDVILPGGEIDGLRVEIGGAPRFAVGERVVLLLRRLDGDEFALVGHGLGVLRRSADGHWLTPDVPTRNGPGVNGESYGDFLQRLDGTLAAVVPTLPHEAPSATPSPEWKLSAAMLIALALLVAVLLRRRHTRAALLVLFCAGATALICGAGPASGEAAGPRGFKVVGPFWKLAVPLRGRVQAGRVQWLQGGGTPDLSDEAAFSTIASQFQQWEDVPESNIAFQKAGRTTETGSSVDERNVISFLIKPPRQSFDEFTLAITFLISNPQTSSLVDTDIAFNDKDVTWQIGGADIALEVVALHEIGHFLGLDHTTDRTDVMFPTAAGLRVLSPGDREGAATLYPVVANEAPLVAADGSPLIGPAPLNVAFTSNGTLSRNGDVLLFNWAFGDGTFSTEGSPAHTYAAPGTYNATFTAMTTNANSASASVQVLVGEAGGALSVRKFSFGASLAAPLKNTGKGKDKLGATLGGVNLAAGDKVLLRFGKVAIGVPGAQSALRTGAVGRGLEQTERAALNGGELNPAFEIAPSGIPLDGKLGFKGTSNFGGKLSVKYSATKSELGVGVSGAIFGTLLDPRGPEDTSQGGSAVYPVTVFITKAAGATVVQSTNATVSFKIKSGNSQSGLSEKSISGK